MTRRQVEGVAPVAPPEEATRPGDGPPPEVLAAALAPAAGVDVGPLCFGVSLLLALAATGPAFLNVVGGRASLVFAVGRFLAAFAVAWAGSALVAKVLTRRPVPALADLPPAGAPADVAPGETPGGR